VLFVILPVLLLLGGGGAAAFMLMKPKGEAHAEDGHKADKAHKKEKKKDKKEAHGKGGHDAKGGGGAKVTEGEGVYYVALDPMLVNIGADAGRPAVLKLRLTLEAPDEETAHMVEPHLPRITDQFLGFLRELRTDDIAGSAGTVRLRLELLRRVNIAIAPAQMNGVLIEEMLVQ
jgi:flagellar FliL protein